MLWLYGNGSIKRTAVFGSCRQNLQNAQCSRTLEGLSSVCTKLENNARFKNNEILEINPLI